MVETISCATLVVLFCALLDALPVLRLKSHYDGTLLKPAQWNQIRCLNRQSPALDVTQLSRITTTRAVLFHRGAVVLKHSALYSLRSVMPDYLIFLRIQHLESSVLTFYCIFDILACKCD